MNIRIAFIVALMLPFRVAAWEDDAVLSFISRANPIIQAQRNVTRAYAKPESMTWASEYIFKRSLGLWRYRVSGRPLYVST